MTDSDLFPFLALFTTLTKVFPFRGDESETSDIGRAYFKTLRKYPFDLVKLGADNCMASMEKFPKPADWAKQIPRRLPGPELSKLTPDEEREWRHAESLGYQGECCSCNRCVELGAQTLAMRFVPLDPEERAMMGDRGVLRGEWIHGEPLIRWYLAREEFWATFSSSRIGQSLIAPKTLRNTSAQDRINAIFSAVNKSALREVGEEG